MTLQAQLTPSDLAQDLAAATTVTAAEAAIERWLAAMPPPAAAGPPAPDVAARGRTSGPPATVGIWRRTAREDGGVDHVRDATLDDDNFWSTAERIGPKAGPRVVLVGESVARGAFVDPFVNCASALRTSLNAGRSGDVDVVDLARSGLTAPWLVDLTSQAMALQPDVVVLFAGNNWLLQPSALDRETIATMLDNGADWRAVAAAFRDAVRRQVANLLFALAETARACGVPLVFVIPANNARDRRPRSEWQDPLLSTAERAHVERELARADAYLDAGDYAGARTAAAATLELDPLVNARALWICGVCALALGDHAEAARRLGEMDDARLYVPLLGLLPCGPVLATAIRDAATAERVPVVDLRDVLSAARDGVPPGRDLFLDQVHMTPLGIHLSMAAVAERVRPLLGLPQGPRAALAGAPVQTDPRAAAQGHFIAALLHGGEEDGQLAAYHAGAAIEHAPELAPVMLSIVRMMVSPKLASYHRAFAEVVEAARRFPGLRLVLYRIPVAAAQPVYVELPRVLAAAAEPVCPGAREECERLLGESALREGESISLLRYAMQRSDAQPWAATRPCYVRSLNPCTRFRVRCGTARDLRLDITARARRGEYGDRAIATLRVNGERVHEWPIGASWSSTCCIVPAALLRGDANDLEIGWPDPGETRADRARTLAAAFRAGALDGIGFPTTLYPGYGDVFAFDARWTA